MKCTSEEIRRFMNVNKISLVDVIDVVVSHNRRKSVEILVLAEDVANYIRSLYIKERR